MSNLSLNFEIPWLMFLLIPALVFTLIPHLRLAKKYRRTRNRIVSIVLHLAIMVMCVSLLSGLTFAYDVPNNENEIILLVDESFSNAKSADKRNAFIESLVDASGSRYKVGILRFAYDTDYIEMTNDTDALYSRYLRATASIPLDEKGTDIEAALTEARSYLNNPASAKIVILTDGLQTDGNAISTVKALAAEGVKVDVVHFPRVIEGEEVQIISADISEFSLNTDGNFILHIQSNVESPAKVTIYDKDETGNETPTEENIHLSEGMNDIPLTYNFSFPGLHELRFVVELLDGTTTIKDAIEQNNELYSFVYLYEFKNILMVESINGEGDDLYDLLKNGEGFGYNVTKVNIKNEPEKLPTTLEELRNYDQVILANISNADLETTAGISHDFDKILSQFASLGGGVFAIGGSTEATIGDTKEPMPHAFDETDMNKKEYDSYYRDLLPVAAEEYRPALGLMILIDKSGSMGWGVNDASDYPTRIDYAKRGARACLDALTYRDWVGVTTFSETQDVDAEISPIYERPRVEAILTNIIAEGGTLFGPAIEKAGQLLAGCESVERRHIIVVTDGQPNDYANGNDNDPYAKRLLNAIKDNYTKGITMSIVGIGDDVRENTTDSKNMEKFAELGGGRFHAYTGNPEDIIVDMRDELYQESITKTEYKEFQPTITNRSSVVQDVSQENVPKLNIFFGTRAKSTAQTTFTVSKLNIVPIYSQWTFGRGKVGAFMSSLRKEWSGDFLDDPYGQRIIHNIVSGLMPTFDIRSYSIKAQLHEENFNTKLSIVSSVEIKEEDKVEVLVTSSSGAITQTIEITQPDAITKFSRASFKVSREGIYKIQILKTRADGTKEYSAPIYKAFSYSSEYDAFVDENEGLEFLTLVAQSGHGTVIDAQRASAVLDDMAAVMHKTYDPRLLFLILSIVLFLLDIAVRKFKFKWPHELISDYREKKRLRHTS